MTTLSGQQNLARLQESTLILKHCCSGDTELAAQPPGKLTIKDSKDLKEVLSMRVR